MIQILNEKSLKLNLGNLMEIGKNRNKSNLWCTPQGETTINQFPREGLYLCILNKKCKRDNLSTLEKAYTGRKKEKIKKKSAPIGALKGIFPVFVG